MLLMNRKCEESISRLIVPFANKWFGNRWVWLEKNEIWGAPVGGRGVRGFPQMKIDKFLGFLVSWFLGFEFSRCLSFVVSYFVRFLVSWFQMFLVVGFLASSFEVSWFFVFQGFWFRGSLVSKFLGLRVSWLLGFKGSMIPFHAFNDPISMIPFQCYQNLISCFLENHKKIIRKKVE